MPKKSGKDTGSLTQKADSQQVRISQVSNVSKAVNAMGKETTQRMKETDRKIAEGGDSKEIAGSMNSVLGSLKSTIDSLNKGVEAATLGTAKAATEAIKQYGTAISEDIKINKQNMVASALATSTPIFGYFAGKLIESGVLKKAKDTMTEGLSKIFKRKEKDSLGDMGDMGGGGKGAAKAAQNAQKEASTKKKDTIDTYKVIDKQRHDKYAVPENEKIIIALTAIQSALGAQIGKFDQWYGKFLLEHPYYRAATIAYKATKATFGGLWKASYFLWKPRGGYKRHLSKAKQPLEAINQNIGALFVQSLPRLDAIMIYTKATAMATRDLSSKVTGKKYPMMDPSKLGGTWTIGGVSMSILRGAGRLAMKGARKLNKSMFLEGSKASDIFEGMISGTESLGKIADMGLTGPGRAKKWLKGKTLDQLPGAKENRRLFGGLGEADETGGMTRARKEQKCIPIYFCQKKNQKRLPKQVKGMGRRIKPDLIVQNVYDLYKISKEKKKDKYDKKLLGYTANSAKFLKKHDKREERRSIWKFLGFLGGGAMSLLKMAFSFLSSPMGMLTAGLATVGTLIVDWFHKNITPQIQGWVDKQMKRASEISKPSEVTGQDVELRRQGDAGATSRLAMQAGVRAGFSSDMLPTMMQNYSNAFIGGRYQYMAEHLPEYGDFTVAEIRTLRIRHWHKFGTTFDLKNMGWNPSNMNAEGARKMGRQIEANFLKWLKKKEKRTEIDRGATGREKYEELAEKYGKDKSIRELDILDKAAKHAKFTEEQKAKKEGKKGTKDLLSTLDPDAAKKWAAEKGGDFKEYVGKTYAEAAVIAKNYAEEVKQKAQVIVGMTAAKAKEYHEKYGGEFNEWKNLTVAQANKLAEKYKLKEKGKMVVDTVKDQAKKISERSEETSKEAVGWFKSTFGAIKDWLQGEEPEKLKDKAAKKSSELYEKSKQKSKEWITTGAAEYNKNRAKLTEIYNKASPEKKAWIRQHTQELLAGGVQTANALKDMGVKFKDAAGDAAEKVGSALVASSVNTTNNVNSAITQMSGGGGGNQQSMMMDPMIKEISMGNVEN